MPCTSRTNTTARPRDETAQDTEAVHETDRISQRHRCAAASSSGSSSSWSAPRLPLDVVHHCVLPLLSLLDFEEVLRVSSSVQRVCEQQALTWMNRTFAAGLSPGNGREPLHSEFFAVRAELYAWDASAWVRRQFRYWQSRAAGDERAASAGLGLQVGDASAAHLYQKLSIRRGGSVLLVRALKGALARHGSVDGFESWQDNWPGPRTPKYHKDCGKSSARRRRDSLCDRLEAAGLQSELGCWDGRMQRYEYDGGALTLWKTGVDPDSWPGEVHDELSDDEITRFAAVHDLLVADCKGRCGWGGCGE